MFDEDGSPLWRRVFDVWGNKTVILNDNSKAKKLEELTIWSFAGLIEIPQMSGEGIYWSKSRVYSKLKLCDSFDF